MFNPLDPETPALKSPTLVQKNSSRTNINNF